MKTLGPIQPDLVALEEWIRSRDDLRAVWLFGSRGRGDARPASDVDLAIWFRDTPDDLLQAILAFEVDAARVMGIPVGAVDVVAMEEASPLLRGAVFRDGRLLLDRSPSERIELQMRALHAAEEARHLWEVRRRVRARQLGVGS